jgi:hypothetical protein
MTNGQMHGRAWPPKNGMGGRVLKYFIKDQMWFSGRLSADPGPVPALLQRRGPLEVKNNNTKRLPLSVPHTSGLRGRWKSSASPPPRHHARIFAEQPCSTTCRVRGRLRTSLAIETPVNTLQQLDDLHPIMESRLPCTNIRPQLAHDLVSRPLHQHQHS